MKKFTFLVLFLTSFLFLNQEVQDVSAATLTDPDIGTNVVIDDGSGYSLVTGDIFTTSATSSSGLVGHSGIAINSSYILHIPGPGKTTSLLTLSQWKSKYAGSTTWVSRVPDSTARSRAASYAWKTYYSSSGTYTQNIKPEYLITTNTAGFDPTYCSKIVWQAYYYGTGSMPVMDGGYSYHIILPYKIRDGLYFNSAYKPYQVAQFNL